MSVIVPPDYSATFISINNAAIVNEYELILGVRWLKFSDYLSRLQPRLSLYLTHLSCLSMCLATLAQARPQLVCNIHLKLYGAVDFHLFACLKIYDSAHADDRLKSAIALFESLMCHIRNCCAALLSSSSNIHMRGRPKFESKKLCVRMIVYWNDLCRRLCCCRWTNYAFILAHCLVFVVVSFTCWLTAYESYEIRFLLACLPTLRWWKIC